MIGLKKRKLYRADEEVGPLGMPYFLTSFFGTFFAEKKVQSKIFAKNFNLILITKPH